MFLQHNTLYCLYTTSRDKNRGKWKIGSLMLTEGHSFKTLRFFQVIRLCSHRFTFMLMTWKISSIFSTVTASNRGGHSAKNRRNFPDWPINQ